MTACAAPRPLSEPIPPAPAPAMRPETPPPPPPGFPIFADIRAGRVVDDGCFAWSASEQTMMCHVSSASELGGVERSIDKVGLAFHNFTYYTREEPDRGERLVADEIDLDTVLAAERAIEGGGYEPWSPVGDSAPTRLAIDTTMAVAGTELRRTREDLGSEGDPATGTWDVGEETLELRCGDRWVELPLAGAFDNAYAPAEITVFAIGDGLLLLFAQGQWNAEGDQGSSSGAIVLDWRLECAAP